MKLNEPVIENLQPKVVACVSFQGNYIGKTEIFAKLFNTLGAWAGSKGLMTPETQFLSSYPDDPNVTPIDELRLDACMVLTKDVTCEGEIEKKILPGGLYAMMHCELTGAEEYGLAWEGVVEWIEENGYTLDMSRPSYEIYLNNPETHPQKNHILDICLSVKT